MLYSNLEGDAPIRITVFLQYVFTLTAGFYDKCNSLSEETISNSKTSKGALDLDHIHLCKKKIKFHPMSQSP